ncbi:AAC(3) family N-acetyltransferase [Nitrosopumilus sp. S6]
MKKSHDYTKEDIILSLKKSGLQKGDSIFLHSNLGFFGKLKDGNDIGTLCKIFEESIFEVIGDKGTLIVPTFSLSFCNNQVYDKKNTPSIECGIFSEYIRKKEDSKRSDDANFSVCAIGCKSDILTSNVPEQSFGKNSFWDRLLKEDGKICRFNMSSDYNTFVHLIEKKMNVSYRFDKEFSGYSIENGKEVKKKSIHFVRNLDDEETLPYLKRLDQKLEGMGLLNITNLGKGQIISSDTKDIEKIILQEIEKNPQFLIKGREKI